MYGLLIECNFHIDNEPVEISQNCTYLGTLISTDLQFCKRYLEASNKPSNVACRAELGWFPLIIAINQKIMKLLLISFK